MGSVSRAHSPKTTEPLLEMLTQRLAKAAPGGKSVPLPVPCITVQPMWQ